MAKNKKKGLAFEKLFGLIFGAIGLVLIVVAIIIAVNRVNFINSADKITGTVTDITYSVRKSSSRNSGRTGGGTEVTYTYEGKEYVRNLSSTSSSIQQGDEVVIYVDKDNPRNIELEAFVFFPVIIIGAIGIPFFIIGLVFLIVAGRKGNKMKRLMSEGRKVYAEVTGGAMNYSYRVNGKHPFKLECRYTDPYNGAVFLYSSENTFMIPDNYIGQQVAVYVDKADYSKYHVDLDSLAEAGSSAGVKVHDFR